MRWCFEGGNYMLKEILVLILGIMVFILFTLGIIGIFEALVLLSLYKIESQLNKVSD